MERYGGPMEPSGGRDWAYRGWIAQHRYQTKSATTGRTPHHIHGEDPRLPYLAATFVRRLLPPGPIHQPVR